ncbi:MAG: LamG-like jellyroll fold domain-containing protein [Eubacteriales bacterium]|nr:LamG-like jellyroll fold domain-containing protein [Eubacteriales bacterium]
MSEYMYQSLSLSCTDKNSFDLPCPDAGLFRFSGEFTIELWIKAPVFQTEKMLLSQKNNFSLRLSDKKIIFSTAGGSEIIADQAELYENTWHSIVVIVYEKDIRILVDNALCTEALLPDNGESAEPVTVGGGFFGNLRWVRVYHNAMMASEVPEYIYNPAVTENMSLYCDFTSNPPKERITGDTISLTEGAQIVRSMPSAGFDEGKYFISREGGAVNPAGRDLEEYSVQVWCMPKAPGEGAYYTVFSNSGENADAGMEIALLKNDAEETYKVSVVHKNFDCSDDILLSVSDVEKDHWCNLAVTFDGSALTLYIDGKPDSGAEGLEKKRGMLTRNSLTIGARFNRGMEADCFHGYIARVDVWEKCLSESEVSAYMDTVPDCEDEGIAAVWRFFDSVRANMITGRPLLGVGDIVCSSYEAPVFGVCRELHVPYGSVSDEAEPLTAAQLEACRRESGILSEDAASMLTSVWEKENAIYIVIHTREASFTVTMLDKNAGEWDELTIWTIELVVLILNAVAMYMFCRNITYTKTLGGKIYTRLIENGGQFMNAVGGLDSAASAKTVAGSITSMLSAMVSTGSLWEFLADGQVLSFWSLTAGLAFLALKMLNPPASFAAAMAMLAAATLAHLAKLPRLLCRIQVNEIYFIHNQLGSIGGINIKKNRTQNWFTPEWVAGRKVKAPVAYRISRFNGDPLKIKVNFTRSNPRRYDTVKIRGVAYGADNDFLGNTSEEVVTFPPGRTKSNDAFFTLAEHRIGVDGIQKKEVNWVWEYTDAEQGGWVQGTVTRHTVYAILSDVHTPWGRGTTVSPEVDLPWTDVYDWTISSVAGATAPEEAAKRLAAAMFQDRRYLYNRDDYIYTMREAGFQALALQVLMDDYFSENHGRVRVECLDCAALLVAQANIYGCDLRMLCFTPKDHRQMMLRPLWAIGETSERPQGGSFDYHCAATDSRDVSDLTKVRVYDSCISYYSTLTGDLVMADGTACAQSAVLPDDGYPAITQETYVAGWLINDNTGIGNAVVATERIYISAGGPERGGNASAGERPLG